MITVSKIPETTIRKFARQHGLEFIIRERPEPKGSEMRYSASFRNCEIKEAAILISAFGNGKTPNEAIRDYANEISLRRIVIGAFTSFRKEIEVPRLIR